MLEFDKSRHFKSDIHKIKFLGGIAVHFVQNMQHKAMEPEIVFVIINALLVQVYMIIPREISIKPNKMEQ